MHKRIAAADKQLKHFCNSIAIYLVGGVVFPQMLFATTGDVIDNFPSALVNVAQCPGSAAAAWADVDGVDNGPPNGVYDTQVVFTTVTGKAGVAQAFPSTLGYWYSFSFINTACGGVFPYADRGRLQIRFVDMLAPGFVWNDPNTWQFKAMSNVSIRSSHDSCALNAIRILEVHAYRDINATNEVFGTETPVLGTSFTKHDFSAAAGIKELFVASDFCENTLDALLLDGVTAPTPTATATFTVPPTATPTPTRTPTTPAATATPTSTVAPGGGACAASVVQTANVNAGTVGTTLGVTVGAGGVPAGSTILAAFSMDQTVGAVSCSDTAGNAYTVEIDRNNGSDLRTVVCAAYNVAALASGHVVQVTHPSLSSARNLSVAYASGVLAVPLDRKTSAIGNSSTPSSGTTAATTVANELIYGVIGHRGVASEFTAGAGFTLLGGIGSAGGANRSTEPESRLVAATGAYAATGTLSTNRNWVAGILTLKCGAALPPTATPTRTPTTPAPTATPTSTVAPGGGACAASVVQTANVNAGTVGTTLGVTVGAGGVPAGSTILAAFSMDQTVGAVSCSDTAGNAYTVEIDRNNGSDLRTVVCAAYNVAALASGHVVQVTHPSLSSARNLSVAYASGVLAVPLDRKTSAIGNSSTPSSGRRRRRRWPMS